MRYLRRLASALPFSAWTAPLLKTFFFILTLLIPTLHANAENAPPRNMAGDLLGVSTMRFTTTTGVSTELTRDPGYLSAAKPDALAFVASDGDIRGAYFEQALVLLRSGGDMSHASDAQIAEAVAALK
jgi:uncharacterized protein (TIGR02448 family)